MTITVELDIYSGRTNPQWKLTADESEALLKELKSLSVIDKNSIQQNDGLGYRGFLLHIIHSNGLLNKTISVYNKTINFDGKQFIDENEVEGKLLEEAKQKGFY